MTGSSFTQVFGGTTIYPSDVSYLPLALSGDTILQWPLEATTGNNIVARIIDVTPTGVYTIIMPDATQVGVGQTILFNNLGPSIVTVDTAGGNAILSMGAGEQWQIYLTDNTTVAGTWQVFRYGAATAQAQASALAGPGIVALGSQLAQTAEVLAFSSSPRTGTTGDRAKTLVWTGAAGTLTLPTAASATNGWFINVRNSGTGDLTIDPSGAETINGASTLTLQPGDSASIVTDGLLWYSIGLGQQAVFAFDYTTIAVTGGTKTLSGTELNRIAYKFTGALGSNADIVVPATVQQYWVNNATSGGFSLSLRVSGSASPVTVGQGTTGIYYSDGTNIIPATTAASFVGTLGVAQGGTGATTAPSALTNLGGTGIGTSVFTAATTAAARTAIAAAASGANSDITSITGLTTALTVAQGGTNATTAGAARTSLGAAASGSNGDITALTNAAGILVGAPTGGAQGVGTLNATGLFINGVGVGTGSGSVTSVAVSGGTTGLTTSGGPVTTSGTITLAGTLAVVNGGTGQTSYTNGQLLIGNTTGSTLTKATLTAGSGITITNGAGSITIASTAGGGSVTSVDGSGGTTGLTLTGGPITGSGTLTLGGTLAVANGGTGAVTASGARLNLAAAASGSNSDITSLSGLTTALSVAQGGTGGITAAAARTSLGAAASGANGDITSITGLTTALSVGQGGTGSTTAAGARTNLGGTTIGANVFTLANPSAITFPRFNADNTVSALDAATFRSAIGAGTSSTTGTVTSVGGTGTVNGLTLTGTVTTSGNLTLGGTLSGVSLTTQVSGTLPIGNGGTGVVSTPTNGQLLIGNGTGYSVAALTAGSGITVTNSAGGITIASTAGGGTVTSVSGTGTVNGLTLTGTVTTSGSLTLGGTLSGVSLTTQVSGTLPIGNGGTNATTAATARSNLSAAASGANTDITSLATTTTINGVTIGYRSIPRSTTTTTAVVGDVGKCIAVSAGITIPNSTFAAGDAISIYNDSASAVTITAGVTTLRQAGTTNTGNRTLAARGMATVWFNSATEAIISGAGVS
jgi:hypothetical protein